MGGGVVLKVVEAGEGFKSYITMVRLVGGTWVIGWLRVEGAGLGVLDRILESFNVTTTPLALVLYGLAVVVLVVVFAVVVRERKKEKEKEREGGIYIYDIYVSIIYTSVG